MNNVGSVKEETRKRVLLAAKQLDYYPNAIAQNFALKRSGNLGVVLPTVPNIRIFSTYYFSEILSGIGSEVRRRGYDLLLLFNSPEEQMDYTMLFKSKKVDGCIILGARSSKQEKQALQALATKSYPFCLVNQHFAGESFNEVDADHVLGSYVAVNHLLAQGYRRIAFLNGPLEYSNSIDRLQGYKQALREAGIAVNEQHIFTGNYSRTSGYRAVAQMKQHLSQIDAVFVANDRMAIGLIQALRESDVQLCESFAVVGYDNSEASALSTPPLTTVDVPFYEMGVLAAAKLLDQLQQQGEARPFREKLATRLVIRQSSSGIN